MSLMPSIVNGISMGAIYGLIAMGLTLIFGTMRVTNFAHGAFMMIAMMIAYTLWGLTGINPYLLIILVGPLMFLFGGKRQERPHQRSAADSRFVHRSGKPGTDDLRRRLPDGADQLLQRDFHLR